MLTSHCLVQWGISVRKGGEDVNWNLPKSGTLAVTVSPAGI